MWETLKPKVCGWVVRSLRRRVDLPVPEGPERMMGRYLEGVGGGGIVVVGVRVEGVEFRGWAAVENGLGGLERNFAEEKGEKVGLVQLLQSGGALMERVPRLGTLIAGEIR